jgi:hypothetical protein
MTEKNFIITSYTEGRNSLIKKTLLHELVASIKRYWPDSYVIIASQSEVTYETQKLADYIIINRKFIDVPHGAGEVDSLRDAIGVLEKLGKTDCFKLCYDFIINDQNCHVFDEWKSHGKPFVSCWWRNTCLGIGSWIWYSTVDMQKKILDFPVLDQFLEKKILDTLESKNLMSECFIYNEGNDMLANTWASCGDQIVSGGASLIRDYGNIVAVVQTSSRDTSMLPLVLNSITSQTQLPNFLLIVDSNEVMVDMRTLPVYNSIFQKCEQLSIPWGVVFSNTVEGTIPSGYTWCWLVDEDSIPAYNDLEAMYRETILDATITSIEKHNQSKLYKLT